jgi:hypothetical protein
VGLEGGAPSFSLKHVGSEGGARESRSKGVSLCNCMQDFGVTP